MAFSTVRVASASASASVTVGLAVTLPAFSISMTAPASAAPATGADSPWSLSNLTDSFTLTPVSGSGSFPGGTTFHWEIEATGGALITRTTAVGENCTVSPADLERKATVFARNIPGYQLTLTGLSMDDM